MTIVCSGFSYVGICTHPCYGDRAVSRCSGKRRDRESNREPPTRQRLLYVAAPGIRDYLEWGGHGVLVFDIDHGHQFVKRISLDGYGVDEHGKVLNVKGVCASATHRPALRQHAQAAHLPRSGHRQGALGEDVRPRLRPHVDLAGRQDHLSAVVREGRLVRRRCGDGRRDSSGSNRSPSRTTRSSASTASTSTWPGSARRSCRSPTTDDHTIERTVGPFSDFIRPFTVNGAQTLVFVNVNDLLGFEIGDLQDRQRSAPRRGAKASARRAGKRHGCPSHGIGLTPDEKEIWVCDAFNSRLHIFDATVMPPKQIESIELREQPGWITFSIDGTFAYPSTGEVIDVKTREDHRHADRRRRPPGPQREDARDRFRERQADRQRRPIRPRSSQAVNRKNTVRRTRILHRLPQLHADQCEQGGARGPIFPIPDPLL